MLIKYLLHLQDRNSNCVEGTEIHLEYSFSNYVFINALLLIVGFIHQVLAIFRCLCSNYIHLILSGMKKKLRNKRLWFELYFFLCHFQFHASNISISHHFITSSKKNNIGSIFHVLLLFFFFNNQQTTNEFIITSNYIFLKPAWAVGCHDFFFHYHLSALKYILFCVQLNKITELTPIHLIARQIVLTLFCMAVRMTLVVQCPFEIL